MRTKRLSIRLTESEQIQIRSRARQAGYSLSEYVITISLQGKIIERKPLSSEQIEFYKLLTYYVTRWQYISNLYAHSRDVEFVAALREMVEIFRAERNKLLNR